MDEHEPKRRERNGGLWPKIGAVFNFIGGVSGLIALMTIAVLGGEIKRQVEVNTGRITTLETRGSPGLVAHEQFDDQRVKDLDRRTAMLENSVIQLSDFKADLRGISVKLDTIEARLKRIEALGKP